MSSALPTEPNQKSENGILSLGNCSTTLGEVWCSPPLEIVLRSTHRKEKWFVITVIAVTLKSEQFGNSRKSLHPEAFYPPNFVTCSLWPCCLSQSLELQQCGLSLKSGQLFWAWADVTSKLQSFHSCGVWGGRGRCKLNIGRSFGSLAAFLKGRGSKKVTSKKCFWRKGNVEFGEYCLQCFITEQLWISACSKHCFFA